MNTKIRLLDEQTINKIAAGEVIENPSSVVKELIENSLDAGATSICIEIQQGGRELIRVSDNGCGMSNDDALLCLERHATSKIKEVEDIQDLMTMGFRGEAIPSIASISKFTLLTCQQCSQNGYLVKIEGGKILSSGPASCSEGTTIEVKALFFNVPVRRKFQKSPNYDVQAILKIISLLALGYPDIQFELISDQKVLLKTPLPNPAISFHAQLANRIEAVLGKDFAKGLSEIHLSQLPYEIEGHIGLPAQHKPNKSGQYLFINQRAVCSPLISSAIREGYGTMLPSQRYPIFVIHLKLPGSLIDVNVHPQKKEVRLRQEHVLKEILIQAVQKSLQKGVTHSQTTFDDFKQDQAEEEKAYIPPFFSAKSDTHHVHEEPWEYRPNDGIHLTPTLITRTQEMVTEDEYIHPVFAMPESPPKALFTLNGYILLDSFNAKLNSIVRNQTGGLCILSQKNAYARIYYERLLQTSTAKCEVQTLLIPLTLSFNSLEARLARTHLSELNQLGFLIREFGEHTFVLEGYPPFLEKQNLSECIYGIIKDLINLQETKRLEQIKKEQFAWIACRASFPSTKRLSVQEAQLLIDRLFACSIPYQCPLGKATIVYRSSEEMCKFFE
jgi:DNA mismatch repair protein MutL